MSGEQTIHDHQLDWGLGELTARAPAPDLTERILDALATARGRSHVLSPRLWRGAAAILLGLGSVVAVSLWPRDDDVSPAAPRQDAVQKAEVVTVRTAEEIAALPPSTRHVNGPGLDDAAVAALVLRCTDLQTLSFGGRTGRPAPRVTDAGLAHVSRLTKLRALDLTFAASITTGGLEHLQSLPLLQALELEAMNLSQIDFAVLKKLPALQELGLSINPTLSDTELEEVLALKGLRRLHLAGCPMLSTPLLGRLTELPMLEVLDLNDVTGKPLRRGSRTRRNGHGVTDATLRVLAGMPRLQALGVAGCDISDAGVLALASAPALERLDLSRTEVGDDALRAVLGARALRALRIAGCAQLTEGIMPDLSAETTLEGLDVSQLRWLQDHHREVLVALPKLNDLAAKPWRAIRRR